MINFWRLNKAIWAFLFAAQDGVEGSARARIQRFRRFLRIERRKMLVGAPIAYIATWFLIGDPRPGLSLAEIVVAYSELPPLGLVFAAPIIAIPFVLLIAAGAYTFVGVVFGLGWLQIRYFGMPR